MKTVSIVKRESSSHSAAPVPFSINPCELRIAGTRTGAICEKDSDVRSGKWRIPVRIVCDDRLGNPQRIANQLESAGIERLRMSAEPGIKQQISASIKSPDPAGNQKLRFAAIKDHQARPPAPAISRKFSGLTVWNFGLAVRLPHRGRLRGPHTNTRRWICDS